MPKISLHWSYYWLGCVIGGIILGVIISKYSSQEIIVQAGPAIDQTLISSPTPISLPPVSQGNLVSIIFTGDVMLGRSVNNNIQTSADPNWPFIYVGDILRSADISYINLESPLVSHCPRTDVGMKFCGDLKNVDGLVMAGVDVASLANNHATNYGEAGLAETISILSNHNIGAIGGGLSASIPKDEYKYTFYSYNDVGDDALKNIIQFPKQNNELVIVTFHWGYEYQSTPNSRQVQLAHFAIDSGADLVIGAHPHWVQTHEIYKNKPIYYSLGNFVFDQEWSLETKRGLAVRFTYNGLNLTKTEELPVFIENYGQPHWL